MSSERIFQIQLVAGYLAWIMIVVTYVAPWMKKMGRPEALRIIAALNAFRFEGLIFILPGLIGTGIPQSFTEPAAYGDLATSILAICAFLTFRIRPIFWVFTVAFNIVGTVDLIANIVNAVRYNIPSIAGQLGATHGIIILYVPLLLCAHVLAFYLLLAPHSSQLTTKSTPATGGV